MLDTDFFNSHESQFGRAGLPMITGAYFMDIPDSNCLILKLASQRDMIEKCVLSLGTVKDQKKIEKMFTETFEKAPDNMLPNSAGYYAVFNYYLYRYILRHYKHRAGKICLWRFIKNLSDDQLNYKDETHPELRLMDYLVRICFHSRALDDLTCIFIPVNDSSLIRKYLAWIKNYFYDANYPSSLLWLYALDSSLSSLFPDEIIYLGREADKNEQMKIPDFDCEESVLLKRFSDRPGHYVKLEGKCANDEFRQIFTFLRREHKDRCLSRSGKLDEHMDKLTYNGEWEKFEDVLKFGVSDESESGCISFSDMRASTEFLNTHGKHTYLNKIQQPFFEKTKIISKKYNGRIDKFMGDNVMSVFLNDNMYAGTREEREKKTVLNNFFAIFALCRTLYELIRDGGFADSNLGLRSGITYGTELLRSNLGNEILRDFTVTGETVNLAARLEHISIQELIIHNRMYFGKAIERFPHISKLISIDGCYKNLNPETRGVIQDFTLYQNIVSNLEKLEKAKFDIRSNQNFYLKLREYMGKNGYGVLNCETSEMYGYEEYDIGGFQLKFYFSYYNPKGFRDYEKIWILPVDPATLKSLGIEKISTDFIQ